MKKTKNKNILITGLPGSGKTTIIKRIIERTRDASGFFTEEIREKGERKGFRFKGLDNSSGILAHVDISGGFRVGRYGVDVTGFNGLLTGLDLPGTASPVVVIDEIGKMECLSEVFKDLVRSLLSSDKLVVATIAMRGGGFIEEVKKRGDCEIFKLTPSNREVILERVMDNLNKAIGNKGL